MKKLILIPLIALVVVAIGCKKKKFESKTTECDPGTTNLQAHFKFSADLSDATGMITGVTSTSVVYGNDKNGAASAALVFNGSNSKVVFPSVFDKNKRTFSLWFKANSYPSGSFPNDMAQLIAYDFPALSNGFAVAAIMNKSGVNTLKMQMGNNAAISEVNMDVHGTALGWNHMVMVQDGFSAAFYVNGKLMGTGTIPSFQTSVSGTDKLILGTSRDDNGRYFNGSIDQFRFYDRTLSACEVAWLYKNY